MARAARKRPTSKREVGAAILDLGKSAKSGKKNKTSQDKASRDKAKQKKAKLKGGGWKGETRCTWPLAVDICQAHVRINMNVPEEGRHSAPDHLQSIFVNTH